MTSKAFGRMLLLVPVAALLFIAIVWVATRS